MYIAWPSCAWLLLCFLFSSWYTSLSLLSTISWVKITADLAHWWPISFIPGNSRRFTMGISGANSEVPTDAVVLPWQSYLILPGTGTAATRIQREREREEKHETQMDVGGQWQQTKRESSSIAFRTFCTLSYLLNINTALESYLGSWSVSSSFSRDDLNDTKFEAGGTNSSCICLMIEKKINISPLQCLSDIMTITYWHFCLHVSSVSNVERES